MHAPVIAEYRPGAIARLVSTGRAAAYVLHTRDARPAERHCIGGRLNKICTSKLSARKRI